MRLMLKFSFPSETGNEMIRSGKINKALEQITNDLKPEAAYFYPEAGQRGGFFVFNMEDSSQLVQAVEPFWFALGADVEITPVMAVEDLMKGLGGIQSIIERYG